MPRVTYKTWFEKLKEIADANGIEVESDNWWHDDYHAGMTPEEAFEEEYGWKL